jgi:Protein of unknown function (DUF3306)
MSRSESFLSRWSRRKAQSGERTEVSPTGRVSETGEDGKETTPSMPPEASELTKAALDLTSLPMIESIAAATDIRPFLQSGVPAELTRAALRRAWTTDPAIRDFIGIAENQWDFNDPTAMPGFGPLTAADQSAALAAQMLGGPRDRLPKITDTSASAAPAMPEAGSANGGDPVDQLREAPAPAANGVVDAQSAGSATSPGEGSIAAGHDGAVGEGGTPRNHRSHGRALPQ